CTASFGGVPNCAAKWNSVPSKRNKVPNLALRPVATLLLALERRRIAIPRLGTTPILKVGLQQGFAAGGMGFRVRFARWQPKKFSLCGYISEVGRAARLSRLEPAHIGETATRSPAAVDFKISNNFGALLSGGESAIGLHSVTGYHLVGVSDEAIERGPIPCQIGVLHGT